MLKKLSFVLLLALLSTNTIFGGVTWEARISTQNDDVEEYVSGGGMYLDSSDLEMPYEDTGKGTPQVIGLRFVNVGVPQGANIANAYVEFTCDETKGGTEAVSLVINGELSGDAGAFSSANNDVTGRARTTAKVVWDVANWTTVGQKDKTSNISTVVQEIVGQGTWKKGNALVLIIADNPAKPSAGVRCADSFSDSATAPLLHIEYTSKYATNPDPADGAKYMDTWVSLSWSPGETAASHDVYLSDNLDDVSNGTADAFRGNQPSTFFVAGFPGFPYPEGLVPGTTYYWKIDEVEANGTTKYQGQVWSFWIPSKKAYNPIPPDGSSFVPTDVTLSWTTGFGAKLHTVYFGDDFDTVSNAAGGIPQGVTSYKPPVLEMNKTYYWRVDEFDAVTTHKGDVWSFTTTIPGLGSAVMDRWENINGTTLDVLKASPKYPNNPDVTEIVDKFAWDGPDIDNYGARIEAWLYVPATGEYTFWLNTDDNGELWLSTDDDPGNAVLIAQESSWSPINSWGSGEEQSAPIPLVAGEKYHIMALWKEGGGGDHCQVAWQGPGIPALTIIPGSNLSPFEPVNAYGARPANRSTGVTQMPILQWKAGLKAASHEVYFGTDADAVANATKASPEYKASKTLGNESYDPGKLAWETTYYWRVDEINSDGTVGKGSVWSFTTANFLIVDDFEAYNNIDPPDPASNRIFESWIDGFGTTTNGALVGNDLPPYAEQTIIHGGRQSMPYLYDNNLKTSEATLTLVYPRDWTEGGVTRLSLWFIGDAANAPEKMFVALNGSAVVYHSDPAVTQTAAWTQWIIDLQAFADKGVNLKNVNTITIGFGTKNSPAAGGSGQMYFDDINLYLPATP